MWFMTVEMLAIPLVVRVWRPAPDAPARRVRRLSYSFIAAVMYQSAWAIPILFIDSSSIGPIADAASVAGLLLGMTPLLAVLANSFALRSSMLLAALKITMVAEPTSRKTPIPLDPGVFESPPAR